MASVCGLHCYKPCKLHTQAQSDAVMLESLPPYIYGEGDQRLFLTLSADVQGHWNLGYSNPEFMFPINTCVVDQPTVAQAVTALRQLMLESQKQSEAES